MEWRFARASKQRTRGTARGCSSRPKPPDEDTQLSGYGAQSSCRRQMPSGSIGEVTRSATSRPLVLQDERPTSPSTHRGVVELPHTVDAHLNLGPTTHTPNTPNRGTVKQIKLVPKTYQGLPRNNSEYVTTVTYHRNGSLDAPLGAQPLLQPAAAGTTGARKVRAESSPRGTTRR